MPAPSYLANHIKGLKEAKAKFQALPDVVRERMLGATETTCREIARQAQDRLLRSPSIRTRALYNAVAWQVTKTNGRGKVGIRSGSAAGRATVDPTRYAHLVEKGSVKMPAEPFMKPAAEAEAGPHQSRVARVTVEACAAVASGGSGLL